MHKLNTFSIQQIQYSVPLLWDGDWAQRVVFVSSQSNQQLVLDPVSPPMGSAPSKRRVWEIIMMLILIGIFIVIMPVVVVVVLLLVVVVVAAAAAAAAVIQPCAGPPWGGPADTGGQLQGLGTKHGVARQCTGSSNSHSNSNSNYNSSNDRNSTSATPCTHV